MNRFTKVDELDESSLKIVELYLKVGETTIPNKKVKSAYTAALIDARRATGRDKNSGKLLINNDEMSVWSGTLTYFSAIDHIGRVFSLSTSTNEKYKKSFYHALKTFSGINEEFFDPLYALRNAFSHQFNLYNCNEKKPDLNHFFTVTQGNELVYLPKNRLVYSEICKLLDSNNDVEESRKTVISLSEVGNLVESMNMQIQDAFKQKKLFISNINHLRKNLIGYT